MTQTVSSSGIIYEYYKVNPVDCCDGVTQPFPDGFYINDQIPLGQVFKYTGSTYPDQNGKCFGVQYDPTLNPTENLTYNLSDTFVNCSSCIREHNLVQLQPLR